MSPHYTPWSTEGSGEMSEGRPRRIGEANRQALDHPFLLTPLNQSIPVLLCSVPGFVRRKRSSVIKCLLIPDLVQKAVLKVGTPGRTEQTPRSQHVGCGLLHHDASQLTSG